MLTAYLILVRILQRNGIGDIYKYIHICVCVCMYMCIYIYGMWYMMYIYGIQQVVKNPPANAEDTGNRASIPGWWRSPGVRNATPLQYSHLKNSMGRGAWQATVRGATKSWTWLSTWTQNIYIWDMWFTIKIGSCNYGDWEGPWSAFTSWRPGNLVV